MIVVVRSCVLVFVWVVVVVLCGFGFVWCCFVLCIDPPRRSFYLSWGVSLVVMWCVMILLVGLYISLVAYLKL